MIDHPHASPSETETTSSESSGSLLDHLDELPWSMIVAYVGRNQYRFVAAINKQFRKAYLDVFPENTQTTISASTLEQTRICYEEVKSENDLRSRSLHLIYSAARHGNLSALQYVHQNECRRDGSCPSNEFTCTYAAKNGHLHVLKWCRQNGYPWNASACAYAALKGHFNVLKWCRQNGCPWNEFTCTYAAHNGHLAVLQWCRQNGCPWDKWTCALAASNGHLNVVKWCRQNGCPWDGRTCLYAAYKGHFDLVEWAQQNGCPLDGHGFEYAAKYGYQEWAEYWLRYRGYESFSKGESDSEDGGESEGEDEDVRNSEI